MHFYGGSYVRGPYSHEPARLEACLLGMQGLGKPGVHQYFKMGGDDHWMNDTPRPVKTLPDMRMMQEGLIEKGRKEGEESKWTRNVFPGQKQLQVSSKQIIPKTQLSQAILEGSCWSSGSTQQFMHLEDQFKRYEYPIPKEEGGTEIHMIWMDNPCRTTCWNDGFKTVEAFRSPKIETIVVQHLWLENDAILADIILPINTKLEEEDIGRMSAGGRSVHGALMEIPGDRAARRVAERLPGRRRGGQEARALRRVHLRDDAPREDEAGLRQHGARRRHQLGGLPGQAVLHRADRPRVGEGAGRSPRVLRGPREVTRWRRPAASWSSTPSG